MNNDIEEEHPWDAALAKTLPGQLVVVGLAYFETDSEEPFEQQQQLFGRVVAADERRGMLLSLESRRSGEEFNLPPDNSGRSAVARLFHDLQRLGAARAEAAPHRRARTLGVN